MHKILILIFSCLMVCGSCNQNTGIKSNPVATDSVAVTNTAEEDTALQEVLELPLKK